MDFSLAALKLFRVQLSRVRQTPSPNTFTLGGILFQRAWLQGVLVSTPSSSHTNEDGKFLLDDGTGVIELIVSSEFRNRGWETGMYVMVVGGYFVCPPPDPPIIKVHKLVDLSAYPDRESMWYLEVIEAFKLFYQPLFEEE